MYYLLKSVQCCHLHQLYTKMTREGAGLIVHSVVTRQPTIHTKAPQTSSSQPDDCKADYHGEVVRGDVVMRVRSDIPCSASRYTYTDWRGDAQGVVHVVCFRLSDADYPHWMRARALY